MCMPCVGHVHALRGHVHALAGASGPSLIFSYLLFSSLVSIRIGGVVGTVRSDRLSNAQTTSLRHRLLPHHLHPMRRLCFVVRFGSRWGKDGARRGIARSRAQKFGNPVRLRLAAIRSIRVTRFDGSSGAAAITSASWRSVRANGMVTPRRPVCWPPRTLNAHQAATAWVA